MRVLHNAGRRTWVSIEPYPTPNLVKQDLNKILQEISFVDRIIFGRTNYCKEITAYKEQKEFYNKCAKQVIEFCKEHNKDYHIKKGTLTE